MTEIKSIVDRFWSKVDKRGPDECWLWKASCQPSGYGQINVAHNIQTAHRLSWEIANGPIPNGMCVLHRCDVRSCVNPQHLFLGTHADNVVDKVSKDRHQYGERSPLAKLTEADVIAIRNAPRYPGFGIDLARRYGISPQNVCNIRHQRGWNHVKG